jgi:hypothetical protein
MAEPELYLSLLSSRYAERRDNDVGSRILQVDKPFHKNPDLLDVLDALAAICVHKEGDVFFVSLAMDTNAATLYVSTNWTVPATVIDHLHTIRRKLKELKPLQVLDFASSPPPNTESPVPNNSQIRSEVELDIQRIIYKYCYKKVQRRFRKRGPEILAQFDTIVESLQQHNRRCRYQTSRSLIDHIHKSLQDSDQKSPQELRFPILIKMIDTLSRNWKKHLGAVGKDGFGLLTQWDSLTCKRGLVF